MEVPISVDIGDTLNIIPFEGSNEIWYQFDAQTDTMAIISSCNMGNGPYDINYIGVSADSINTDYYNFDYYTYEESCTNGLTLEFPVYSGHSYFIFFNYSSNISSATWFLDSREIVDGDVCEQGLTAEKETAYEMPEEKAFSWYNYTPAEDENMVIGITKIVDEYFYAGIDFKLDCDCEFLYYGDPECSRFYTYGTVVHMEAGNTYHIGWYNREHENIIWSIYDPTEIMDFSVNGQIEAAEIDHENHTIDANVTYSQSLSNLKAEFVKAFGIEFFVNDTPVNSGENINCTNPVLITVRYTDPETNDTISQDWTLTVTQSEAPPPGPYTVKSNYLKNPDVNKPFVTEWADFWKSAYDPVYGGFYTDVDNTGNPTDDYKSLLSQSRDAYAFARAFMVSGDTSYLSYADKALQFMYSYLWDDTYGGWYSSVNNDGSLYEFDSYNTFKWSFMQHYANLGIVAMSDAVGGVRFEDESLTGPAFNEHTHWQKLNNSLDAINESMWDDREDYYGYYYRADLDWGNPSGKGFTPTVDGITTHGLYMYLLTKDPFFETRFGQLADNIEEHLIPGMESSVLGFPEDYSSDWEMKSGGDKFIGHMFKTAWCLARAYLVNPQEKYRSAAKFLMNDMLNNGAYDYTYGAPYSGYDWSDGYIDTDTKSWWDIEQAYNSGIMNYYICDEDDNNRYKYLEVADGSIDFFMKHFVDEVNGEVYSGTDREGNPISTDKGNFWKAGYHSTEFAYYAYLYGNLFYKEEPVDLYYFIDKSEQVQSVSLYPLAIEDNLLKIDAIELEGVPFDDFNPDTRTLNIPSNTGGIFKVTFSNYKFIDGINELLAGNNDGLDVIVYPNPLSGMGIIEYTIENYSDVSIQILDIAGRVIYATENKNAVPGTYQEYIDHSELGENSVCFIRVKTSSQSITRKLILLD